ncbi:uncharacterized protein LOC123871538 isoform X1 [Maniola jurtina]|uniref:uncharacterized protein LOC123871538 isoform X1 n=1 Tax=Maniola jurtina TaxID=191418 RepID=UPI001E68CE47|nr:uncharacterized protein LOC123871538 isoform X1 [Maniola jurtina]
MPTSLWVRVWRRTTNVLVTALVLAATAGVQFGLWRLLAARPVAGHREIYISLAVTAVAAACPVLLSFIAGALLGADGLLRDAGAHVAAGHRHAAHAAGVLGALRGRVLGDARGAGGLPAGGAGRAAVAAADPRRGGRARSALQVSVTCCHHVVRVASVVCAVLGDARGAGGLPAGGAGRAAVAAADPRRGGRARSALQVSVTCCHHVVRVASVVCAVLGDARGAGGLPAGGAGRAAVAAADPRRGGRARSALQVSVTCCHHVVRVASVVCAVLGDARGAGGLPAGGAGRAAVAAADPRRGGRARSALQVSVTCCHHVVRVASVVCAVLGDARGAGGLPAGGAGRAAVAAADPRRGGRARSALQVSVTCCHHVVRVASVVCAVLGDARGAGGLPAGGAGRAAVAAADPRRGGRARSALQVSVTCCHHVVRVASVVCAVLGDARGAGGLPAGGAGRAAVAAADPRRGGRARSALQVSVTCCHHVVHVASVVCAVLGDARGAGGLPAGGAGRAAVAAADPRRGGRARSALQVSVTCCHHVVRVASVVCAVLGDARGAGGLPAGGAGRAAVAAADPRRGGRARSALQVSVTCCHHVVRVASVVCAVLGDARGAGGLPAGGAGRAAVAAADPRRGGRARSALQVSVTCCHHVVRVASVVCAVLGDARGAGGLPAGGAGRAAVAAADPRRGGRARSALQVSVTCCHHVVRVASVVCAVLGDARGAGGLPAGGAGRAAVAAADPRRGGRARSALQVSVTCCHHVVRVASVVCAVLGDARGAGGLPAGGAGRAAVAAADPRRGGRARSALQVSVTCCHHVVRVASVVCAVLGDARGAGGLPAGGAGRAAVAAADPRRGGRARSALQVSVTCCHHVVRVASVVCAVLGDARGAGGLPAGGAGRAAVAAADPRRGGRARSALQVSVTCCHHVVHVASVVCAVLGDARGAGGLPAGGAGRAAVAAADPRRGGRARSALQVSVTCCHHVVRVASVVCAVLGDARGAGGLPAGGAGRAAVAAADPRRGGRARSALQVSVTCCHHVVRVASVVCAVLGDARGAGGLPAGGAGRAAVAAADPRRGGRARSALQVEAAGRRARLRHHVQLADADLQPGRAVAGRAVRAAAGAGRDAQAAAAVLRQARDGAAHVPRRQEGVARGADADRAVHAGDAVAVRDALRHRLAVLKVVVAVVWPVSTVRARVRDRQRGPAAAVAPRHAARRAALRRAARPHRLRAAGAVRVRVHRARARRGAALHGAPAAPDAAAAGQGQGLPAGRHREGVQRRMAVQPQGGGAGGGQPHVEVPARGAAPLQRGLPLRRVAPLARLPAPRVPRAGAAAALAPPAPTTATPTAPSAGRAPAPASTAATTPTGRASLAGEEGASAHCDRRLPLRRVAPLARLPAPRAPRAGAAAALAPRRRRRHRQLLQLAGLQLPPQPQRRRPRGELALRARRARRRTVTGGFHFDASRLSHAFQRPEPLAPELRPRSRRADDGDTDSSFSWQGSSSRLNRSDGAHGES